MFGVYRPATPGDLAGMQPGVSGHMYAREVLKRSGALFPSSIRYGEDTAFHYAQYPCCTAYVQLPLTGYIVHRVAGSSSSSSSESVVDMIEATDWLRIHYERLGWPGGTAESLLRYASHAWRRVCSMAPHGKVLASANRLRSVLQSVPGGELALASLRSRDARSLASVLAGGRGLSFSYYWKRLCKGVGLLKR